MGPRYVADLFETMGRYGDALKFAGGSFTLLPRDALRQVIDVCHRHDVLVSTGGFIEYVVTQSKEAVSRYVTECKDVGFDIIEVSSGFITLPTDDWLRLVACRRPGSRQNRRSGSSSGRAVRAQPRPSRPRGRATSTGPSSRHSGSSTGRI